MVPVFGTSTGGTESQISCIWSTEYYPISKLGTVRYRFQYGICTRSGFGINCSSLLWLAVDTQQTSGEASSPQQHVELKLENDISYRFLSLIFKLFFSFLFTNIAIFLHSKFKIYQYFLHNIYQLIPNFIILKPKILFFLFYSLLEYVFM